MPVDPALEARITRALEAAPQIDIPAGFAARVAARAPRAAESDRMPWGIPISTPRVGIWAVRVALAVLLVAMFVFAPQALSHRALPLTIELLLTGEFVVLTAWAGLNPRLIR